ncbi:MAG TPA: hypothetical protein VFM38_09210, partial [Candidatus Limnocylindrales bacterium]|nr:hypothetical protein [Candidatus Limnocylindrales bacterium]
REDGEADPSIAEVWTEVDEDGFVTRELGFNDRGGIVHRMPSQRFSQGTYGLFDLALIDLSSTRRDIPATEFERRWHASLAAFPER